MWEMAAFVCVLLHTPLAVGILPPTLELRVYMRKWAHLIMEYTHVCVLSQYIIITNLPVCHTHICIWSLDGRITRDSIPCIYVRGYGNMKRQHKTKKTKSGIEGCSRNNVTIREREWYLFRSTFVSVNISCHSALQADCLFVIFNIHETAIFGLALKCHCRVVGRNIWQWVIVVHWQF